MDSYDQFSSVPSQSVSNMGLISKTLLGVFIVFLVAIPRLFSGKLFLSFLYTADSLVTRLVLTIIVTIILCFIWNMLYRALKKDKGLILNLFIYILSCAFLGLFIANSLIFAVIFIGFYANGAVDANMILQALQITTVATFIAIVGGTLVLPSLKFTGPSIRIFNNLARLLVGLALATFILWIIGTILAIFHLTFILEAMYKLIYGIGPLSIVLSIIVVIAALASYLIILSRAKMAVDSEAKHLEYYYSMLLVNAIARVYVEVFKLVLKILAAANKNRD